MTTNRNDPLLRQIVAEGPRKGQQEAYLVLSDEERAKGFVRPVRCSYKHLACGGVTRMGQDIAETYARNPRFYSGTFCVHCGTHFDLVERKAEKCLACDGDGGEWVEGMKGGTASEDWHSCQTCHGQQTVFTLAPAFLWEPDGEPVGSNAEEAAEWNANKAAREAEKTAGAGI